MLLNIVLAPQRHEPALGVEDGINHWSPIQFAPPGPAPPIEQVSGRMPLGAYSMLLV